MRETNPMLAAIDCPPLTDSDREQARLTVCRYATDAADAGELLAMLGLIEPQPTPQPVKAAPPVVSYDRGSCTECGVPTYSRRARPPVPGGRRYGARGRCEKCYMVLRRAESPAQEPKMVDSAKTLAHLESLRDAGITGQQIADAFGLPATTLSRLLNHRPLMVRATTEERVLTVRFDADKAVL
ncbi:hypothetical protein A5733_04315 [Mycobacterium sp. NS-7484]|uniref:hypothetical protein n=1 Tax=Mycobacterium sp. NS-7484 TaxID=1834161 RepID=UPI00096CEA72|nr:hypothetical protein [Mycobacterium sp. NS-7484]OMC00341.1 hypothetical protein A5733_04315 [Mycobacterium sp. NS-7484]